MAMLSLPPQKGLKMIEVRLPDGSKRVYEGNPTAMEVAESIAAGLARKALSARFNGEIIELSQRLTENGDLVFYTWEDPEGKQAFWHSSAHLLAQTLQQLFPGVKLTIGPAIERGFYYDVDFGGHEVGERDFERIEKAMLANARKKAPFQMRSVKKEEALRFYADNPFKKELIADLEDGTITFCDHDDFTDLCRGGHVPNTGFIKAVKVTSLAGAYWRGDEKRPQLTRVYGISFPKASMLEEYLAQLEEAKKRDHRKLGKELGLFTFSQAVGQGLPMWLPKGAELRERLSNLS
jgi:Threonyl-tRNA synthetase